MRSIALSGRPKLQRVIQVQNSKRFFYPEMLFQRSKVTELLLDLIFEKLFVENCELNVELKSQNLHNGKKMFIINLQNNVEIRKFNYIPLFFAQLL